MRSGILIGLIAASVCVGATAAEQSAQVSPGDILIVASGDPNEAVPPAGADPNGTWDPNEHLVVDWESVAVNMGSLLLNPKRRPDVTPVGPQWSLSVTAVVDIIDSNGLIGWSLNPTSVVALDQDGRLVSSTTSSPPVRMYQQPVYADRPVGPNGELASVLIMNYIPLKLPTEPTALYPEVLSRVEWTMNMLVAEEIETVDVPFKASDTWVELTPGMEILVEQATVEEGKYQYRIKFRNDRTKVAYVPNGSIHLWNEDQPPATAVVKVDVLNAEGKSIRSLRAGGSLSSGGGGDGSGNQISGTFTGSGTCSACGTAATIRYTLVFDMYEQEARFALENIPVPQF